MNNSITYENSNMGFMLTFPQSWNESYSIKESDAEYIEVYFIGQSKLSKGEDGNGLFMYAIGTEEALIDSYISIVKKIGMSNGKGYYYAIGRDYPLSALDVNSNEFIEDLIRDKDEIELIKEDFIKASEMEKDIPHILQTFQGK